MYCRGRCGECESPVRANADEEGESEDDRGLTPGRREARARALENVHKQAIKMQKRVAKKQGKLELAVGDVVRVAVANVDRGRLDPTSVPMVVVEIVCHGEKDLETKYRLACRAGVYKTLMGRYDVECIQHMTHAVMGLTAALNGWGGGV